jgi:hypothetical protein
MTAEAPGLLISKPISIYFYCGTIAGKRKTGVEEWNAGGGCEEHLLNKFHRCLPLQSGRNI